MVVGMILGLLVPNDLHAGKEHNLCAVAARQACASTRMLAPSLAHCLQADNIVGLAAGLYGHFTVRRSVAGARSSAA